MPTAWQGTPAGPASARAASVPGGERGGNGRSGAGDTQRREPRTPCQQQPRPRIGPESGTEFWASGAASLSSGTMDVLCDCGLVTEPLWAVKRD